MPDDYRARYAGDVTAMLRLLVDAALDGPTNMARDEALLMRVGRGESPSTLRLYQWSPPTISLGYFQPYADYEALAPPARDLAVVRRPTGGGAILHDQELTYSITLPADDPIIVRHPNRLYELAHDAIIAALAEAEVHCRRGGETDDSGPRRGPFFCFARRHTYDVLIGSDKLAGSAQRRTRRALLQHGSIVLGGRFAQQPAATLPLALATAELARRFPSAFAALCGTRCAPGDWTDDELAEAEQFRAKHAGPEWIQSARSPGVGRPGNPAV